jgi:hypothetical protein
VLHVTCRRSTVNLIKDALETLSIASAVENGSQTQQDALLNLRVASTCGGENERSLNLRLEVLRFRDLIA